MDGQKTLPTRHEEFEQQIEAKTSLDSKIAGTQDNEVEITDGRVSRVHPNHSKILSRSSSRGLITWILVCCSVLGINLISAIVAIAKQSTQSGIGTLFSGTCGRVNDWATGLHIAINVLSSLLLSASNFTMQIICAPTRQELDVAHAKGEWLEVGVLSFRNHFRGISVRRTCLSIFLAISSLPLHLLYNSVVFKSTGTFAYVAAIVQPGFVNDARMTAYLESFAKSNETNENFMEYTDYLAPVVRYFNGSSAGKNSIANLTASECMAAYAVQTMNQRSDVLLISNCPYAVPADHPNMANTLLNTWTPGHGQEQYSWMCGQQDFVCTLGHLPKNASDWQVQGCNIEYCLSRLEQATCELKFSLYILLAVTACNIAKVTVMIWTLFHNDEGSIITIGDAITSYLTDPDPHSAGKCLASKADITSNLSARTATRFGSASPRRWASAVGTARWCVTVSPCLLMIILAAKLLQLGIKNGPEGESLPNPYSRGFGELDIQELLQARGKMPSLIKSVLITNTPQLIISFLYVGYNGLWTAMLLASEFNGYYLERKSLRVTNPVGQQRSTYWLQLPYRYSIPLLLAMITLHWLVSESFFAAQLDVQDSGGLRAASSDGGMYGWSGGAVSVIGYSVLPILLAIVLGSCLVVAVIAVGCFRKLRNPMPLVSSCSLAIAAACHRPEDDEDAAYGPVSWGAVDIEGEDGEVGHCCFTSRTVHAPVPGNLYA